MAQHFRYAQLVIGPAGSGKSTYCHIAQQHSSITGTRVFVVNLDPAAEHFKYNCDIDIKDCISLDDVMEEMHLGPNGGLVFALEYLVDNIDWLEEQCSEFMEDDMIILDCPGQIELFTHLPVMSRLVQSLQRLGFSMCAVYCVDSTVVQDPSKFISASFTALAAMNRLGIPHINVLTKCDLVADKTRIEELLEAEPEELIASLPKCSAKFVKLNTALAKVVGEFNVVQFHALDISDEDSISNLALRIDMVLQLSENKEVHVRDQMDLEEDY
jgi:GTPase SAR1 family protein